MGLDMWMRAKTKKPEAVQLGQNPTGVAGGVFGVMPDDEGMIEIGYWRKAYEINSCILDNLKSFRERPEGDDGCCTNFKVEDKELDYILYEADHVLMNHEFDQDGFDVTPDYEWAGYTCWAKQKWESLFETLRKAKAILRADPEAEIYYCMWY